LGGGCRRLDCNTVLEFGQAAARRTAQRQAPWNAWAVSPSEAAGAWASAVAGCLRFLSACTCVPAAITAPARPAHRAARSARPSGMPSALELFERREPSNQHLTAAALRRAAGEIPYQLHARQCVALRCFLSPIACHFMLCVVCRGCPGESFSEAWLGQILIDWCNTQQLACCAAIGPCACALSYVLTVWGTCIL
jgi:hypothetical protein